MWPVANLSDARSVQSPTTQRHSPLSSSRPAASLHHFFKHPNPEHIRLAHFNVSHSYERDMESTAQSKNVVSSLPPPPLPFANAAVDKEGIRPKDSWVLHVAEYQHGYIPVLETRVASMITTRMQWRQQSTNHSSVGWLRPFFSATNQPSWCCKLNQSTVK